MDICMQGNIHTLGKCKGRILPYFMPPGIGEREAKHHNIVLQFGLWVPCLLIQVGIPSRQWPGRGYYF